MDSIKIAVEGCCHGELDRIYDTLEKARKRESASIDLLICCGDFQAARNDADLATMAVPLKYRKMNSFYKYYSGKKTAPVPTLFIGGNHEASNHLWELSYGGWVAPKMYYLGNAGVVRFGGLRIAGLSGIYKRNDYGKGRFERPPYNEGSKRSAYHVRSCDVFRLKQLSGHVDIMLSHDWPQGIYHHGNKDELLQKKPYFADEISRDELGSPPAMELLQHLRPDYWFSAHLHVKFAAAYHHEGGGVTKFLALDKCLPRRQFLQILDLPTPSGHAPLTLEWDPEWLAILRATEPLMRHTPALWLPPHPLTDERHSFTPTQDELAHIDQLFDKDFSIPNNFTRTVTPHDPARRVDHRAVAVAQENPQTADFCRRLGIDNPYTPDFMTPSVDVPSPLDDGSRKTPGQKYPWLQDSDSSGSEETLAKGSLVSCPGGLKSGDETKLDPEVTAANPDEIVLSDSSDNSDLGMAGGMEVGAGTQIHAAGCQPNPDEIALSDSEDGSVDQSQTSGQTRGLPTPARGWGIPETVASVQGSESVPTAAAGSSAEKDSVMLQEQLRSDGSGDSRGSTALGRRPLLLPNPAHPGAPSSADAELTPEWTTGVRPGAHPLEEASSSSSNRPSQGSPDQGLSQGSPDRSPSQDQRLSRDSPDQRPKIKRRNVALYTSRDEDSD